MDERFAIIRDPSRDFLKIVLDIASRAEIPGVGVRGGEPIDWEFALLEGVPRKAGTVSLTKLTDFHSPGSNDEFDTRVVIVEFMEAVAPGHATARYTVYGPRQNDETGEIVLTNICDGEWMEAEHAVGEALGEFVRSRIRRIVESGS